MTTEHVLAQHPLVRAALEDPHLVPLPAEGGSGSPARGVDWLRASVARFAAGAAHARRRALVERDLARLDPDKLRAAAAAQPGGEAHHLVVAVLAEGLGLGDPEGTAAAVATLAPAYFGGADAATVAEADAAVAWLLPRMGVADDEEAANRIGLLAQACGATATLVAHARRHPHAGGGAAIEDVLAETLRLDPPVLALRRVAVRGTRIGEVDVAAGDRVLLDVAAADRDPKAPAGFPSLAFGADPRRCPGAAHALAIAAGVIEHDRAADELPATDGRDPAEVVSAMVAHVLDVAATWTAWDGEHVPSEDRVYTPHKAVRRVADHLLDHLAELEARLAGEEPEPDHWHGSATTTPADAAPFTADDLDEARSRLVRLARMWSQRLGALTPEQLDRSPGRGWTFRQLAFHLDDSAGYADAVGRLSRGTD